MSAEIHLPLTASVVEIAEAIIQVQARCKARLCRGPTALATRARLQIDRAQQMADAVGLTLTGLYAGGAWWEGSGWDDGESTLVELAWRGVRVRRGSPGSCNAEGTITLALHPPSVPLMERWSEEPDEVQPEASP